MKPEDQLKADVVKYLNQTIQPPQFYERMQSGKLRVKRGYMHLCAEGTADFVIFEANSFVVWLELKAGRTKKSRAEAQAAFADKVRALGHCYYRCESVADVQAALGMETK